jgi:sugar phosphate isomerase/epimerase
MSPEIQALIKKKLKDSGITLVDWYDALPNNEAKCREIFNFAKDMGVEQIVSEPDPNAFGMLDRLCQEYNIKVAIHNHPKPNSDYWTPKNVLEVCKGRSKWIGACPDTGHWTRSGLNAVDCIKMLQGHIITLHLKDINKLGDINAQTLDWEGSHDVIWGTGVTDIKGVLTELDRQGFKGYFAIEYEYNWKNSLPEIHKSIEYFNKVAASLQSKHKN